MNEIMLTVFVISGISGILAIFLTLANKTIGDYGIVKLLVNKDKEFECEGGDTLLSLLVENEIFIPSACGGKGSCGFCKIIVEEGGGRILATERGYINQKEQEEGFRLACQCKVKNDIRVDIPKELLDVKQYEYHVEYIYDVTPTIKHLKLNLPEDKSINFKAGQYVQLYIPKYKGNKDEVYRAYSIASSPNKKNQIELLIGNINGIATTYVHQHLQRGNKITIVGPYGEFYYNDSLKEMVMVAIGTGMAPILSILKYMKEERINRKVTFYFGAKSLEDVFFKEEFESLEKELSDFRFIPTLSRPKDSDKWDGDVGRVTDSISKYMDVNTEKEAYLCGSPKMIDSVKILLIEKGISEEFIYYDKFE